MPRVTDVHPGYYHDPVLRGRGGASQGWYAFALPPSDAVISMIVGAQPSGLIDGTVAYGATRAASSATMSALSAAMSEYSHGSAVKL